MISLVGHIRRIPQSYDKVTASGKRSVSNHEGISSSTPPPTFAARGEWIWSGIWVYGALSPSQVLGDDMVEVTKIESSESIEQQQQQQHDQSTRVVDTGETPPPPQHKYGTDGTKRKGRPSASTTTTVASATSKGAINTSTTHTITNTAIHTSSRFGSVSTSWLQKIHGSRPFLYKFQEYVEPQHVLIPSANYYTTSVPSSSSSSSSTTTSMVEAITRNPPNEEEKNTEEEYVKKTETRTELSSTHEYGFEDKSIIIQHKGEEPQHESKIDTIDTSQGINRDDSANTDIHPPIIPENILIMDQDNVLTAINKEETIPIVHNTSEVPQHNHIVKKEEEITFATLEPGESFTDAGIVYPKRSPVGGCWKGYFENESKRKDRNTSHVAEIFYLFLNASPPSNARFTFPEQEEDDNEEEEGTIIADPQESPSSATVGHENQLKIQVADNQAKKGEFLESNCRLIHVRGTGSNQFGIFEILGSYNVETGILNCQRIYVFTRSDLEGPFVGVTDHRQVRKLRLLSKDCPSSLLAEEKENERNNSIPTSLESKTYFTRKRPVSFKRYNTSESENEESHLPKVRSNSMMEPPRKRFKSVGDVKSNLFSSSFLVRDNKRQRVPSFSDTSLKKLSTSADVADSDDGYFSQYPMDGNSSPLILEHSASIPKKKLGLSRGKNTGKHIILPPAGDPKMARWRAAHFFYYQKIQDSPAVNDTPLNTSSPFLSKTTTVNYVVYEGEMYNEMRDGVGVCSYNNHFIYEGQWKNNKEHGFGTLLTSDRSQTIYTGEWERGKLNGKGTYNYYVSNFEMMGDGTVPDTIRVGCYEGDFRENIRTGMGKYTFSDGSFYFGDWMNNVPTGRGTFQWSDGSTYEGSWRDGKRHGQGLLKASDGFLYDGQWVNNAMEGRGIALYPHGTRYEGSWLNGKREGRGTLIFREGAVYEGRFKDDNMDGQGTLQLGRNMIVPSMTVENIMQSADSAECSIERDISSSNDLHGDWMIPIAFQSNISSIHQKAGFTHGGD